MRITRNAVLFASMLLSSVQLPAQSIVAMAGPVNQAQQVEFGVFLPLQNTDKLDQLLVQLHDESSQNYRHWLSPSEFQQQFGPKASDITAIQSELATYHIQVVQQNAQGLRLRGNVADIQRAFHTRLTKGATPQGQQKMIVTGGLTLPSSLQQANAAVIAFSPRIRMHPHSVRVGAVPDNRYSPTGPYWFDDLKQAYNFPSYQIVSGSGRSIGILMANDFQDQDMATYFGHERLPVPKIIRVPINGGAPFDANASAEISLDIQQAGGMAPNATIYDYNVPDLSDPSLLEGLIQILSDNTVDIVNMSFGGPEAQYTPAYNQGVDYTNILRLYDSLYKQGNAQGITFIASSGDSGALGLPPVSYFYDPPQGVVVGDFQVGVEFPASSPHVTAVGGTNLITKHVTGSLTSAYMRENAHPDPEVPYDPYGVGNLLAGGVWGSGGGVSDFFTKPSYQRLVNTGSNMRTIPDLSLQMGGCPGGISELPCGPNRSATVVALGGKLYGYIGTSVSAPGFAGVLASTEAQLGGIRFGNANNYIYSLAAAQDYGLVNVFHQGIPGNNGFYYSQKDVPGYNYVLGNGTLSVRDFMLAPNAPKAGIPQTPSNP